MEIFLQILILVAGFALLIKGADVLVSGASSVAANFKVSKMLIGLTIVAFGTSAPELAVSISSLISGKTDLLLGNVIGSNILNVLLLLGIGALICPIVVKKNTVHKELPILLLISTALIILFLDIALAGESANLITRSDAIICILFFLIFLYYLFSMAHRDKKSKKETNEKPQYKLGISFLLTVLGLAGVVGGSQLVVNSASNIAATIGISERIISLTIVALGTSLPELVTTVVAAKRKETDLIIGNIIGSNIFNICVVMGIPVAIFGTITQGSFEIIDLIALGASTILLCIFAKTHRRISRWEGLAMLALFAAYYGYILYGALA